MTRPTVPCRLFVYLAREAPVGVVLRRGPSAWCRLSVWHTDTDTFEHGQWFKGRVYERRCDVSPDGSLFLYFAAQSGRLRPAPGRRWGADSWVAISRPPYFTALALWFAVGTWSSGGYFADRRSLWQDACAAQPDKGRLPRWLTATASVPYVDRSGDWTNRTVFISRLLRDGWERDESAPDSRETWRRDSPAGDLTLAMVFAGDGSAPGAPHRSAYAVLDRGGRAIAAFGRATWADWDQRGRLVIARDGRLFRWRPPDELHELADFNPHVPAPIPAPVWATVWPKEPPRGGSRGPRGRARRRRSDP